MRMDMERMIRNRKLYFKHNITKSSNLFNPIYGMTDEEFRDYMVKRRCKSGKISIEDAFLKLV